ncbi:TRAP transporter small permease [Nesterenkonia lutea]|uniref:TRAP-type C4-dicarboxylate transport system permease small subunit n=1 Tax=Nesterenkonia lutea TaxID=272919 RepID=A0ABR9JGR9_9MICC|nr:TRAP transporter small permease [Nesterenkonia lutea]MBE1525123.1 TRAP-type C4-dicarboxylate transport system permease small subunit [Nesterenkonia lutea]
MERLVVNLSRVMGVIAALAIVVLMAAIVTDVVTRYLTGSSMPAMVELSESALVVSIFFGLAWAGASGAHVSVTLVTDRLSARLNRLLAVTVWVLTTLFVSWLTFATAGRAMNATGRGETRMGIVEWPTWPLRWVIVAGFLALLLVSLANLVRALRGRDILPAQIDELPRRDTVAETGEHASL